jgi:hypothetical protein
MRDECCERDCKFAQRERPNPAAQLVSRCSPVGMQGCAVCSRSGGSTRGADNSEAERDGVTRGTQVGAAPGEL